MRPLEWSQWSCRGPQLRYLTQPEPGPYWRRAWKTQPPPCFLSGALPFRHPHCSCDSAPGGGLEFMHTSLMGNIQAPAPLNEECLGHLWGHWLLPVHTEGDLAVFRGLADLLQGNPQTAQGIHSPPSCACLLGYPPPSFSCFISGRGF